jgi:hypothetical protein
VPTDQNQILVDDRLQQFKYLWEPDALGTLRDTMTYDGTERLIQQAYEEGWTDDEVREKGIATGLKGWSPYHTPVSTTKAATVWSAGVASSSAS